MNLILFALAVAVFVAAVAVRIAWPPIDQFRWRIVSVRITADTSRFVAAMREADRVGSELEAEVKKLQATMSSTGVSMAELIANRATPTPGDTT